MEAVFSKLIDQLNSSVFVLLMLLAAAFYACCKITSIVTKWNVKHEYNEERITKVEDIYDTVIATRERVQIIYDHLIQRGGINNPLAAARSPMTLTAQGEEAAKEINAKEIFEKNVTALLEKANQENPQTAYDIQAVSFKVANEELPKLLTQDEMNRVKQSAYDRGIPILHTWIIFGLYLRDRILQDKGIASSDLDMPKS